MTLRIGSIVYLVEEVSVGLRTKFAVRSHPLRIDAIEGDWVVCGDARCGSWLLRASEAKAQELATFLNEWSSGT